MTTRLLPMLFLAGTTMLACSRDEPTPPQMETGDDTGADTGPGPGTDPGTSGADDAMADTTAATTLEDSTGAGSESGGEDCVGRDGCFDCAPTQNAEFLDHCTDATCEPFSNTMRRLPLLEADGSLPAIP